MMERTRPPCDAIDFASDLAKNCGLLLDIQQFGTFIKTTVCNIVDADGFKVVGKGKGLGQQSIASAIYEALEHYRYHKDIFIEMDAIEPFDFSGADKFLVGGSPDFALFNLPRDVPVSRRRFNQLGDERAVLIPAFLSYPNFSSQLPAENLLLQTTGLKRYSSNSGVASGTTRDEAILHALLELVERDALGLQLIGTVFRRTPYSVRRIRLESLPSQSIDVIALVAAEVPGVIDIFDITSDVGIPAVLARFTNAQNQETYFGSGASLSAETAIMRAVLEAVQGFHVYSFIMTRDRVFDRLNHGDLSKFQKCLLEFGIYDYSGGETLLDYSESSLRDVSSATDAIGSQINVIVKRLMEIGVLVYLRDICRGEPWVVQLAAPKLERFFLISAGLFLAPGARGRTILT